MECSFNEYLEKMKKEINNEDSFSLRSMEEGLNASLTLQEDDKNLKDVGNIVSKKDKKLYEPNFESVGEDITSVLPTTDASNSTLKFISPETLIDVVQGKYRHLFKLHKVIDCRYPYEFTGGHVIGARNFSSESGLAAKLFESSENSYKGVLIFYCEFSSQRAPGMARAIRRFDRNLNADCYPRLCYPQIFVMEGGYKRFYEKFPDNCNPEGYVSMMAPEYRFSLKAYRRSTTYKENSSKKTRSTRRLNTAVLPQILNFPKV
ncbi:DgyrCDS14321 [Dimorphilus gyrociliatus]|uniref:protein-tyrosine-phosphatase n=1 Tax=Dimorphilus gyrociliatus TaxID=2664684 RepID=A0A7I8WD81_9ANNE|nr:DgyrCDS14321 [Dimorphilus gyrociliatus]